jgi:NAD(P)-dependent dehydrogenase (short-subunit alcohol dehydrogenase family)
MKNYLVIGGSSGIGQALCQLLNEEGHTVYASYCQHVQENTGNINYFQLDVLQPLPDMSWLPDTIDGVVYCPGSIKLRPFHRIKVADFAKDYELQVLGAIKILQTVLPALKQSASASVVMFSTVAVQTGFPFHAQVASSKGAIEGLMRSLAADFAPKIRVNCVAPSLTDTPLASTLLNSAAKLEANAARHPLKRVGTASEIAAAAAYLLSDKAGWMTGQVLKLDGGMSSVKV